jgi:hypothetical protein
MPQKQTVPGNAVVKIALLVCFSVAFAAAHVKLERTFHFWDYQTYHDIVRTTAAEFRSSIGEGVRSVGGSLFGDRPSLWALPLVPITLILGDSRVLYVASLVLIYQIPYFLLLGGLCASLMRGNPGRSFWACSTLALLVPALWMPALLGFPDVSSAALIAAAMLLYVHPSAKGRKMAYVGIGAALAFATLFRRHYAYTAIAFFAGAGVDAAAIAIASGSNSIRSAMMRIRDISIAGITALAVMLTIGAPFTMRALGLNVSVLYESYEESPLTILTYFGGFFGWSLVALSIAGWITAFALKFVIQERARPIAFFFIFEVGLWFFVVAETNPQFILHFTTLVVLGLAFAVRTVMDRAPDGWSRWIPITSAVVLFATLLSCLVPTSSVADVPGRSWGIARHRPLQRADYDEIVRLVQTIRRYASPTDPVFIGASSYVLNRSSFRIADYQVPPRPEIWIASNPDVDSRDFLPLSALMVARFVVLTTPVQYHLRAEEQDVVRLPNDALKSNWEIGQDFERLPEEFSLQGATATIYRRTRPSSLDTALKALDRMEAELGARPAEQADWVSIGPVPGAKTEDEGEGTRITAQLGPEGSVSATFVYLNTLPAKFNLSGTMRLEAETDAKVGIRLFTMNATGEKKEIQNLPPQSADGRPFEVSVGSLDGSRLILEPYNPVPMPGKTKLELRSVQIKPQ